MEKACRRAASTGAIRIRFRVVGKRIRCRAGAPTICLSYRRKLRRNRNSDILIIEKALPICGRRFFNLSGGFVNILMT